MENLKNTFARLNTVELRAKSLGASNMQWNKTYCGKCNITIDKNLIYVMDDFIKPFRAVDYKIWQIDDTVLNFWHHRLGKYEQVFSFLLPHFELSSPYQCGKDKYSAGLRVYADKIVFTVYVHSARKNEQLTYFYY